MVTDGATRRAVVVGAGVVGLSCAWHLQSHGVEVTVLDRTGVGAGASHGNAGYVAPGMVAPLADPALVRYGARAVLRRRSPVRIPLTPSTDTLRFLLRFTRNATQRRWRGGMRALQPLSDQAEDAFDELADGGVAASRRAAPVLAVFQRAAQAAGLLHEVAAVTGCGQTLDIATITGEEARAEEPLLSDRIEMAVKLLGQRSLDPADFCQSLGAAVQQRGARLETGVTVLGVESSAGDSVTLTTDGAPVTAHAVVLATGAWLPALAGRHGVSLPMQSGRGYSFVVDTEPVPRGPIYFPAARAAGAVTATGLRMTGLMDLDPPEAPLDHARVRVIQDGVARSLAGVDWSTCRDEWVGSRPLTADGLPLIGPTRSSNVYVAGGHGMWGLTLGPVTGRLLARAIVTQAVTPELLPFDPTR